MRIAVGVAIRERHVAQLRRILEMNVVLYILQFFHGRSDGEQFLNDVILHAEQTL